MNPTERIERVRALYHERCKVVPKKEVKKWWQFWKKIKSLFRKNRPSDDVLVFGYWCMQSGECTQSCTVDDYKNFLEEKDKWTKLWSS